MCVKTKVHPFQSSSGFRLSLEFSNCDFFCCLEFLRVRAQVNRKYLMMEFATKKIEVKHKIKFQCPKVWGQASKFKFSEGRFRLVMGISKQNWKMRSNNPRGNITNMEWHHF